MTDKKLEVGNTLNTQITTLLEQNQQMPKDIDELLLYWQDYIDRKNEFAPDSSLPAEQQQNQNFLRFRARCYQVLKPGVTPPAATRPNELTYFTTLQTLIKETIGNMQAKHDRSNRPDLRTCLTQCIKAFTLMHTHLKYSDFFYQITTSTPIAPGSEEKKFSAPLSTPSSPVITTPISMPPTSPKKMDSPIFDEKQFRKIKDACDELESEITNCKKPQPTSNSGFVFQQFNKLISLCYDAKLTSKKSTGYLDLNAVVLEIASLRAEIDQQMQSVIIPDSLTDEEGLIAKLQNSLDYALSGITTVTLAQSPVKTSSSLFTSPATSPSPSTTTATSPSTPSQTSTGGSITSFFRRWSIPTLIPSPLKPREEKQRGSSGTPFLSSPVKEEPPARGVTLSSVLEPLDFIIKTDFIQNDQITQEDLIGHYSSFLANCVAANLLPEQEAAQNIVKFFPQPAKLKNFLNSVETRINAHLFNFFKSNTLLEDKVDLYAKMNKKISHFFNDFYSAFLILQRTQEYNNEKKQNSSMGTALSESSMGSLASRSAPTLSTYRSTP